MGFRGRKNNPIVGFIFGLLMLPGSVILLSWNEYRTIHRTRGLNEAEQVSLVVENPARLADADGQLVFVTGKAETEAVLEDEQFGIRANAIRFARRVSMYQWDEKKTTRNDRTEYKYSQGWHDNRIDSSRFHRSGYANPPLKFQPVSKTAEHAQVGAYALNAHLKDEMSNWQSLGIPDGLIQETVGQETPEQFLVQGSTIYWSAEKPDPDAPKIGDQRIWFQAVVPSDVSLMARQRRDTFTAFETSNGEKIHDLFAGRLTKQEFVDKLRTENATMAWILRLVGFALSVGGVSCILGPLRAMVSWIPLVGELTGKLFFGVAVLAGVVVSAITIAVAWIAVRPLLAVALILLAVVALVAIYRMRQSFASEPPVIEPM